MKEKSINCIKTKSNYIEAKKQKHKSHCINSIKANSKKLLLQQNVAAEAGKSPAPAELHVGFQQRSLIKQ
jgi:hypothetical protein